MGIPAWWPRVGTARPGLRAERGPSGLDSGRTLGKVGPVNTQVTAGSQTEAGELTVRTTVSDFNYR